MNMEKQKDPEGKRPNPERHSLTFGITCLYIGGTDAEEQTGQFNIHESFTNLSS